MIKGWTKHITIHFNYKDEDYEADLTVEMTNDSNYGADADGNRGVSMTEIDIVTVDEVRDSSGKVIEASKALNNFIDEVDLSGYDLSQED